MEWLSRGPPKRLWADFARPPRTSDCPSPWWADDGLLALRARSIGALPSRRRSGCFKLLEPPPLPQQRRRRSLGRPPSSGHRRRERRWRWVQRRRLGVACCMQCIRKPLQRVFAGRCRAHSQVQRGRSLQQRRHDRRRRSGAASSWALLCPQRGGAGPCGA